MQCPRLPKASFEALQKFFLPERGLLMTGTPSCSWTLQGTPSRILATVEPHVVELPDPSSFDRKSEVELAPVLEFRQRSPSSSHPASLGCSFPPKWTHGFSQPPLVIEVFAGSARLSKACRDAGFGTLAIDHKRGEASFPVLCLDLTVPKDQFRLRDILLHEAGNIALLHFAPPCGTASAARGRPIPGVPNPA